jgi:3-phosphoshikimate 1-carboxyvinyltransferase
MTVTVTPRKLSGSITPPPSKSQAHRLLLAAALAEGDSLIQGLADSDDITATKRCLEELGASFERTAEGLVVHGMAAGPMSPRRRMALPHLDCGESGSTLRFLIPVALAVRGGGIFTGRGRLMERPQGPYFDLFQDKGIFYSLEGGVLTVQGELKSGAYRLPGDVSSQFFTGLLYALPLLEGPSAILPTTQLESMNYIDMTAQALETFGVQTVATLSLPPQYHVSGGQTYRASKVTVERDWSQAAFWYAAVALGSQVEIEGMNAFSTQGDMAVVPHFLRLTQPGDVELDVSQCPDLVPPLAAMAAVRGGTTRLVNAGRLRIKESDRLASVTQVLNALGAQVEEYSDHLIIRGREKLAGGVKVDSYNDHRIAMMAAIAATCCQRPVTIAGAECVAKSYPNFWEDYQMVGGEIQCDM